MHIFFIETFFFPENFSMGQGRLFSSVKDDFGFINFYRRPFSPGTTFWNPSPKSLEEDFVPTLFSF